MVKGSINFGGFKNVANSCRKNYILELLDANGKVKSADLVKEFEVSSETVRKYLEELEKENRLKRVYGGAIKVAYGMGEPEHLKRTILHADQKKRIGEMAASLVKDNEVIAIDEGTTPFEMIKHLMGKKNLTIVTSSYPVLSALINYENQDVFDGEVIFIGGRLETKHLRTTGAIAIDVMSQLYVDKAFVSAEGILINYGISSYSSDKALLSRKYVENSKESIALCDYSKIGVRTFHKISDLKDIDIVISDTDSPKEWKGFLDRIDTRWFVAK